MVLLNKFVKNKLIKGKIELNKLKIFKRIYNIKIILKDLKNLIMIDLNKTIKFINIIQAFINRNKNKIKILNILWLKNLI